MARPLRIQYPGAFYHVTCRGNERRRIFLDDPDRYRFTTLLAESLEIHNVVLYAYVLMDNHFHLVVQTPRANLSEFMRRFNICYTGWFNYHHETCGHLYQGRYKALLIDVDTYMLELSRYVHLNPTRVGRVKTLDPDEQMRYLQRFRWSSLPRYLDKNKITNLVSYDMVLSMVGNRRHYRRFLQDGLRSGMRNPFKDVQYHSLLGDDDFVAQIRRDHLPEGSPEEQPSYREMAQGTINPDGVLASAAEALGVDLKEVRARMNGSVERCIIVELLYRYSGITQHEIGQLMGGVGYTAVSMMRRRLNVAMKENEGVRVQYERAEHRVRKLIED